VTEKIPVKKMKKDLKKNLSHNSYIVFCTPPNTMCVQPTHSAIAARGWQETLEPPTPSLKFWAVRKLLGWKKIPFVREISKRSDCRHELFGRLMLETVKTSGSQTW